MLKKTNKAVIGIDIGGTKMAGVLWNGKKVLKTVETATPKNLAGFKLSFVKLVKSLGNADRIAVGAAGIVNKNKLVRSPNIPYIKNFNFPKRLDNDARCFARAEYKLGSAAGKKTAFFITLGTGVGRAVVKNGKILKIKRFEFPEKWEREYQKIRDSKNSQKLAEYLGKKITELAKPYSPEVIVVGGGILSRKGFFEELKKRITTPVKKPRFHKNGVAIGAAIMFNSGF